MDEPPIYFFTYNKPVGSEWRFAWQWPLPNEKRVKFYLGGGPSQGGPSGVNDGTLSATPPTSKVGQDEYMVDYSVNASNRNQKGLTYTTAPWASDVEMTGDPVVELWVSSTATPPSPSSPGAPTPTPVLDPPPTVTVYRNTLYPSHLVLPIGGYPLPAKIRIQPEVLCKKSQGVLTAFVSFPEGLDKGYLKDIKPDSLRCYGAAAVDLKMHKDRLIAKFRQQELNDIVLGAKNKLTVTGAFGKRYDYGNLTFEGSDEIRMLP